MIPLVLLLSGREDERFTDDEANISLVVDSVGMSSGFRARIVVVDGER